MKRFSITKCDTRVQCRPMYVDFHSSSLKPYSRYDRNEKMCSALQHQVEIKNSASSVPGGKLMSSNRRDVQCRVRVIANRLLDRGCSNKVSMKEKRKGIEEEKCWDIYSQANAG